MHNQRLVLVLGALAVVSAVVAGFVIFGDTPEAVPPQEKAPTLAVSDGSLVVGDATDAPYDVVVSEDFGSPGSREFELASRDFLRIEGARGDVRVHYRPVRQVAGEYARSAHAAYLVAQSSGTPRQVMALHDVLFERQPPTDSAAPEPAVVAGWAAKLGLDRQAVEDAITAAGPPPPAPGGSLPVVTVNGTTLEAGSGTSLADRLQSTIVEGER